MLAEQGNLIPLVSRVMSDHLTPVLAYRRLVAADERTAPSFLLESVENGDTLGRHSFLGAQPVVEVLAHEHEVTVIDHIHGNTQTSTEPDPLIVPKRLTESWRVVTPESVSQGRVIAPFTGGWVGYAGYDTPSLAEGRPCPYQPSA